MSNNGSFTVGDWLVEPDLDRISRDDSSSSLRPHVMALLVYLARQQGRVAKTEDLLDDLWAGKIVTDGTLYNCVAELRHALDDEDGQTCIETIPKKGYRLIAPVSAIESDATETVAATKSQIRLKRVIWVAGAAALLIGVWIIAFRPDFDSFPVEPQGSAKSIAVLPFVNVSDDASNEYFSDGLSEELLNLLAKVPELRVAARTSSFSFKDQSLEIPVIAARLNVAHVLEGSVRKSGSQIRVTVQLIKADDGFQLWSERYDRELDDIFAIQDDIAGAVVDALKITLLGEELKATETNPEAYALYLQGRHFLNQHTAESNKQAETLLKQALAIDPGFAPAWTELGRVYGDQAGVFGLRPIDEGYELARHAIQQALTIDPQYGRAYAVLARVKMSYDYDFTAALQHLQQALALNPGDAAILNFAARLNRLLGRLNEAIDLHRQSIALDPLSPAGHFGLGATYYWAHRLDEAADSLQMALSFSPGRVGAQYVLGLVLQAQGDAPAALVAIEQETSDGYRLTGTAIVQHALGDAGASDAALEELIEKYAAGAAYQVAEVYAFRGEIDYAFDWLNEAYDNRDAGLPQILIEPLLANLHDDPRWELLLDKMGLPH